MTRWISWFPNSKISSDGPSPPDWRLLSHEARIANRHLSADDLTGLFAPLLEDVRARLIALSSGDPELLFALRRKLAKELSYDERGKPMQRKQLKAFKRGAQNNKCAICGKDLPTENVVLDRFEAMKGYTPENTRLVHKDCDYEHQKQRGFA